MFTLTKKLAVSSFLTRSGLNLENRLMIHSSVCRLYASKEFEDAKARLGTLQNDPGNDVKLKLYALFKQATVGPCNTPKPGMMDFVNRAKWTAWSELKISKADAEKEYIKLVDELAKAEKPSQETSTSSGGGQSSSNKFKEILVSVEYGSVYKIVLNRPSKLNAITFSMYRELIDALKEADADPKISMCCITGAGDYFCSGNDLTNFQSKEAMTDIKKAAKNGGVLLEEFVNAFVEFSKPLAAVINGPAVGISVTLLGLFDLVLSSDRASFYAPFTKIAQSPEACSTVTFPAMMGPVKASEFLLFNRKLTAREAYERNLLTEVIEHAQLDAKAWKIIEEYSRLPKESLLASKRIVRSTQIDVLKRVNKQEVDTLVERWSSGEFVQVMMDFWKNKSKK